MTEDREKDMVTEEEELEEWLRSKETQVCNRRESGQH